MPKVKNMMLIRRQNLVAYTNFSDDVVFKFVHAAARNGIDVFRIFDALDDVRNHEAVIKAVKEVGKVSEGAVCYTISPVHTIETFVSKARQLEDKGVDQIAIKDMAGLIDPHMTFELVSAMRKAVKVPIHLHTHDSCGFGMMSALKAVEAGAEMIDSVLSPFTGGTGHPCTESLVYAFHKFGYETGCDLAKLTEAAEEAKAIRTGYQEFEAPYSGVDCRKCWSLRFGRGYVQPHQPVEAAERFRETGRYNKGNTKSKRRSRMDTFGYAHVPDSCVSGYFQRSYGQVQNNRESHR